MTTSCARLILMVTVSVFFAGCTRDTAYLISNGLATAITRSEEPRVTYSQYASERRTRSEGATLAANLAGVTDPETVRREVLKVVPVGTPTNVAHATLGLNGFSCTWDTPEKGRCAFPETGSRELAISAVDGKLSEVAVTAVK